LARGAHIGLAFTAYSIETKGLIALLPEHKTDGIRRQGGSLCHSKIPKRLENLIANAWQKDGEGILMRSAALIVVARVIEKAKRFVLSVLQNLHILSENITAKSKKQPSLPMAAPSVPAAVNLILNSCRSTTSAEGGIFIERSFAEATAIAGAVGSVYTFGSNGTITRKDLEFSAGTATALTVNWATALTSGSV
jgi:hypothetical protein